MSNDIAVIGLAAKFPGANSVKEFWQNLCAGRESIRFFSKEDLLAAGIPEDTVNNPDYVRASPVLEEIELFDAEFFGIPRREAEFLDPQQRLFLTIAWEALETAGYSPNASTGSTGVFAGSGGNVTSYLLNCLETYPDIRGLTGSFRHLGNDKDFLATRVSYKLNLRGPSLAIQTACSTSLVAVHIACKSILSGECDMALAGAVNVRVPHLSGYLRQEGDFFSEDGHCRPFAANATGILFGSGAGVVVLKHLDDAIEDRDTIYAVVKGSAINNDGGPKLSYTASSLNGQVRCISEALEVANVHPETIGYVEAHGTGTKMGDPIEVAALTQAFRKKTKETEYCGIGSVKANVGHLDVAAGIAGLIKAVYSLYKEEIPPSINIEAPNPKIDFARSPFYLNRNLKKWRGGDLPRRAAVNSLGIGGTNAFVILEEAPKEIAGGL